MIDTHGRFTVAMSGLLLALGDGDILILHGGLIYGGWIDGNSSNQRASIIFSMRIEGGERLESFGFLDL